MSPEGAPSPPEFFRELLSTGASASAFRLDLDEPSLSALGVFLAELDRWRRAMDLTGPLSAEELAAHTLESASGAVLLPKSAAVVDIGSGAGFPGVPLAIVRPDLMVTLVEPRQRRAEFLRHLVRDVPLGNTTVFGGTAGDLGTSVFDVAITRALGNLAQVIDGAEFLREGGVLLAWTTQPLELANELSPYFTLNDITSVPGSERRVIARYALTATALPSNLSETTTGG